MVVRLQIGLVTALLTIVASNLPLSASSTQNTSVAINDLRFPPVLQAQVGAGGRADRFMSSQQSNTSLHARRLSGIYGCRWDPNICAREPIRSLTGPDCCGSLCTNIKKDGLNCGQCGRICFFGSICCNGSCIDIFTSHRHCGGCHNTCPDRVPCQYGLCDYS